MSVHIIRFSTDAERIPEVEAAIENLFASTEEAAPTGIHYTAARVGDGAEFQPTLQLADDDTNPLLELQAALSLDFRARIAARVGAPVSPQPVTVLGRCSR